MGNRLRTCLPGSRSRTSPDWCFRHHHDGAGRAALSSDNPFGPPATEVAIRDMRLNHFNLAGQVDDVRKLVGHHMWG